jgi:hypothetical protein
MTNKIETGGPAFPCDLAAYDDEVQREMQGMSLRDYFAAKAMQALIASPRMPAPAAQGGLDVTDAMVADLSYKTADAMMKARGK